MAALQKQDAGGGDNDRASASSFLREVRNPQWLWCEGVLTSQTAKRSGEEVPLVPDRMAGSRHGLAGGMDDGLLPLTRTHARACADPREDPGGDSRKRGRWDVRN